MVFGYGGGGEYNIKHAQKVSIRVCANCALRLRG